MGPLVPEIIGNELNLVVALLLGFGFGFVLEQAGFSSSRKLAGLFYGYDFVVLRVFFTAGVTAMIGVIILTHFGWLDLSLIYVNPTFLKSALLGGVIMGAGFIIGGFCPGTSVCAAAIGRIDAMAFLLGTVFGVFAFAEGYPLFVGIYKSSFLGNLYVFDALGVSRGLFAFLMVAMAIAAFVATTIIENRVNGRKSSGYTENRRYFALAGLGIFLGFVMIFMPDHRSRAIAFASGADWQVEAESINRMTIDELAFRLIKRDRTIQLIDVRSPDKYTALNIPTAVNIPFDSLANPEWRDFLQKKGVDNIFYADGEETALRTAVLSMHLGDNTAALILKGGFESFQENILAFSDEKSSREDFTEEIYEFRKRARTELDILRAEAERVPEPVKKPRTIQGGC